jgi:hypothetical protein
MPHRRLLALAVISSGVLLAGCGGSSRRPTAATVADPGSSASKVAAGGAATSSASTVASAGTPDAIAFARCMRANGVPNFPDPASGGGFSFQPPPGFDRAAPAVRAAQAKCQKFAPQPPDAGRSSSSPQQTAHALAQLRAVAQCMRQHGISDFPDPTPTPSVNPSLGKYSEITNYEGVFLLFPATIDMQSPAWNHAAAACGALAESFNHPHH